MELNQIFSKYFNPVTVECSKVNTEICKRCGGSCCKSLGCHISPFDLKEITFESIISLIDESGCISIDWWEGNPIIDEPDGQRVYFLRIKNQGAKVIDPSFGGICSILTDIGCPLSYEYRPKGARDLIPKEGPTCHDRYSKRQCAIDWYSYQDIMKMIYFYYYEKGDMTDTLQIRLQQLEDSMLSLLNFNE